MVETVGRAADIMTQDDDKVGGLLDARAQWKMERYRRLPSGFGLGCQLSHGSKPILSGGKNQYKRCTMLRRYKLKPWP